MTDAKRATELGSLFESITGHTSVVESQRETQATTGREIDDPPGDRTADPIEYYGFSDVIDESGPADGGT